MAEREAPVPTPSSIAGSASAAGLDGSGARAEQALTTSRRRAAPGRARWPTLAAGVARAWWRDGSAGARRRVSRSRELHRACGPGSPLFATLGTVPETLTGSRRRPGWALPANEIRDRFIGFFAARGHAVVPSASLVPAGDQTLLFTNSGMVQFKDVLRGVETRSLQPRRRRPALPARGRQAQRLRGGRAHAAPPHASSRCSATGSFGDYFKREAIHWAWELLTEDLRHPRLTGSRRRPTRDDEEAWDVWRDEIGLPPERMARWGDVDAGDDKNFWRMADTGPCGPCSEIHYDRGAHLSEGPDCVPDHSEHCPRWLEIWNLVFMEFDQQPDGGASRCRSRASTRAWASSASRRSSRASRRNYDTDLFTPIHARMRELLGHDPDAFEAERFSYQVIADHSRAITFLIADGVLPSNEGRGYVLRRIVRRAVRHGRLLGRREPFLAETAERRHRHHGRRVSHPPGAPRRHPRAPSSGRRPPSRGRSMRAPSTSRRRSSR